MSDGITWINDGDKTTYTAHMGFGMADDPAGFPPGKYFVQVTGTRADFYGPIDYKSMAAVQTADGPVLIMGRPIPHAGHRTVANSDTE